MALELLKPCCPVDQFYNGVSDSMKVVEQTTYDLGAQHPLGWGLVAAGTGLTATMSPLSVVGAALIFLGDLHLRQENQRLRDYEVLTNQYGMSEEEVSKLTKYEATQKVHEFLVLSLQKTIKTQRVRLATLRKSNTHLKIQMKKGKFDKASLAMKLLETRKEIKRLQDEKEKATKQAKVYGELSIQQQHDIDSLNATVDELNSTVQFLTEEFKAIL